MAERQDSVLARFAEAAGEGDILVTVQTMSGQIVLVAAQGSATLYVLKSLVCEHFGVPADQARLGCGAMTQDDLAIDQLIGDGDANALTLMLVCFEPFRIQEEKAKAQWCRVAQLLQDPEVDDASACQELCDFLDRFPSMINLQAQASMEMGFKPLLAHAALSAKSVAARERCVATLLERGARVSIRHDDGWLVQQVVAAGSPFAKLLEKKAVEFGDHERRAVDAWRKVSSQLCGEVYLTGAPRLEDDEMAQIVHQFCTEFPEMVNFQSNHAHTDGEPRGLFGYSPLLTFAGACKGWHKSLGADYRKGSVRALLQHGAHVSIEHGGKGSMEWVASRGSPLTSWLEELQREPALEQAEYSFSRTKA